MARKSKRRGYRVHGLDSPEAETELRRQDLTRADLDQAITAFEQAEKTQVGTFIGISEDGVFGSDREDWSPDQPTAFAEPLIVIPWVQILELLGRLPKGTTGRLLAAEPRRD
jgi:hypothetical protein